MREFLFIRHAPITESGCLIGRSDWTASLPPHPAPEQLRQMVCAADLRICSPAKRCQQTAAWLGGNWQIQPGLWEQNFGIWEAKPYSQIPDLGVLSRKDIAQHRPPQGESFLDVTARVRAVLMLMPPSGQIAIMAHAGIIRAALGLALDQPEAGLAFSVDPLSLTRLREVDGAWNILCVNRSLTGEDA